MIYINILIIIFILLFCYSLFAINNKIIKYEIQKEKI